MGGYTPEALAKYWAYSVVHDAGLGLASEAASNAATVLLRLLGTSDDISWAAAYRDQRDRAIAEIVQLKGQIEDIGTKLAAARLALDEKNIPRGKWRYVRMNQPAPERDDFVVIAAAEYEAWRLRFKKDRDDQDAALKDAIAENVALRAELDQAAGAIADRNRELEEATQARGRLRLWLEFIHLNAHSGAEAKEFSGEAMIGKHVPEGFDV